LTLSCAKHCLAVFALLSERSSMAGVMTQSPNSDGAGRSIAGKRMDRRRVAPRHAVTSHLSHQQSRYIHVLIFSKHCCLISPSVHHPWEATLSSQVRTLVRFSRAVPGCLASSVARLRQHPRRGGLQPSGGALQPNENVTRTRLHGSAPRADTRSIPKS
jgi:hypothetical protein